MTYLDYILVGKGFLYPLRHKKSQRGGFDDDDGQANIPVKVRGLPNKMISDSSDACNYKGRQEADKTTQKTERRMLYAKTIAKCLSLLCDGNGITTHCYFCVGVR